MVDGIPSVYFDNDGMQVSTVQVSSGYLTVCLQFRPTLDWVVDWIRSFHFVNQSFIHTSACTMQDKKKIVNGMNLFPQCVVWVGPMVSQEQYVILLKLNVC